MKYIIEKKKKFKKNLKKCRQRGLNIELLDNVIFQLANGQQLSSKYNDHKLWNSNKYAGCRECHIEPDWLLIYKIVDNKLILTLTDTGSHSDLF